MDLTKNIYSANGWLIRQLRCADFSAFGQDNTPEVSKIYPEVPYRTIIIDKIYHSEIGLFLKQIFDTWGLFGKTYDEKRLLNREEMPGHIKFKDCITQIVKTEQNLKWVIFDGKRVRQFIDPDVVQGVNDLIYPFVPKNTIGVEDLISEKEQKYVFLHELVEREKMNLGLTYRQAHHLYANRAEHAARRRDEKYPGSYPGDKNFKKFGTWEEFKLKFQLRRISH